MTCVIIDDEPIAHSIIEEYIKEVDGLELVKNFYNAIEAAAYLNFNAIDIIFLDIKMPKLKGLDFIRSLTNPPAIIITTAYAEYAVESFELPVVDYLLKPFTFQRFFKAYNKILSLAEPPRIISINHENVREHKKTIFLKGDKEIHQVKFENICYIESYGGYVKVFLSKGSYLLIHQALYYFEDKLSQEFIRIHRSFIVNKNYIISIIGNSVKLELKKLPIGKSYKKNISDLLNSN